MIEANWANKNGNQTEICCVCQSDLDLPGLDAVLLLVIFYEAEPWIEGNPIVSAVFFSSIFSAQDVKA